MYNKTSQNEIECQLKSMMVQALALITNQNEDLIDELTVNINQATDRLIHTLVLEGMTDHVGLSNQILSQIRQEDFLGAGQNILLLTSWFYQGVTV